MGEILCLKSVSLTYQAENGEVEALKDINFTVNEGEIISIIGPSGCGKTTLLSLISGLESPTSGEVRVGGHVVKGVTDKIGYMLQKDNLLDWRTIRSNTLLGLEIRKMLCNATVDYADDLLKTYGLWEFRNMRPSQLSGGMRQRAALIRTLAAKPGLLLLDESFSALDYQTRLAVTDDVYGIIKRVKIPAILVTHDISDGISMADRLIVLTKRPASISRDIKIEFSRSEIMSPLQRRNDPLFREYFNLIWKELDVHE
ncbi:MAG: ABC transporter ATP-binding protein [Defluviitaleaceae bacterium]|nr:ABC transporter ATP-binding protein [Defluviitaleaceae bacterium]